MQLIVALCTFGFVACQEYEIDSQPEGALNIQIDAQDEYTAMAISPSNIVFNISSNTPWTIDCDAEWCHVTPAMSAASSLVSEIVVSLDDNTDEGVASRVATLTISAEGLEATRTVRIEQLSSERLNIPEITEMIPSEGNAAFEVRFFSNKDWEVIPSVDFLTDIDRTSGSGSDEWQSIVINVPANPGARREGSLTFKTSLEEAVINVTQNGITIELEDGTTSFNIGGSYGTSRTSNVITQVVTVNSNAEWVCEVADEYSSWLSAEKISDNEMQVTALTNNLMITRTGYITMKTKEVVAGFDGIQFEVNQSLSFWYEGGSDNYEIDDATGYMTQYGSGIVTSYYFQKGRLILDFESINLEDDSDNWIEINSWPDSGNTNWHLHLHANGENSNFTCGGTGLYYTEYFFSLSTAEVNAIKQIIIEVAEKEDQPGYLVLNLYFDGEIVATLDGNSISDNYGTGSMEPGQPTYIRLQSPSANSNFVLKSLTWEPAE